MDPVNPTKKAKIVFSPSNVDHYERLFMLEHDIAMGYVSPAIPREKSMVERMNEAFPVPSPLHASFRRWIEHNQAARFDCFRPPSWVCTCYKCVTYQLRSEKDVNYFELMKDEQECAAIGLDTRGILTADRVTLFENGSPALADLNYGTQSESDVVFFENIKNDKEREEMLKDDRGQNATDRLQMLCDVAARAAANTIPVVTEVPVREPINVEVIKVCHFFTEMNFDGPDAPTTPKLTTIQFLPDSDLGKEQAQRAWIQRMRMTPVKIHF